MSQANRRVHPRQLRRVQVKFNRLGEDRVLRGFTKNLSLSGALITSAEPAPRGATLRIELMSKEQSLVIYGKVVHAHRMPPELRRFAESAMGVRFLETADLVKPFLPENDTGARPRPGTGASRAPSAAADRAPGSPEVSSASRPETDAADAADDALPVPAAQVYPLLFERAGDFLTVFHRDIVNGGLFVSTSRPARLYEQVVVALHLPGAEKRIVQAEARVVQVVEPRQTGGGRTSGGMGLELMDTDRVLRKLRPVVEGMRA
jgi:Tfp pilus assembly protein PilZ